MPIDLSALGRRTRAEKTVLLFGAGSSIPSGAPSAASLTRDLATVFKIEDGEKMSLADLTLVIEKRFDRKSLIHSVTQKLEKLHPVRGLLTLPDFLWAGLYTTNYDELIEKSYKTRSVPLNVIASNYDFGQGEAGASALYKLHGTIRQDISLGHQSRMIITTIDYDQTNDYREALYAKFTEQLYTSDAIIIGSSLSDPDLRSVVDAAVKVKRHRGAPGKITLFVYEKDENQALVYESKGLDVCFGGIDDFFAEMAKGLAPTKLLPGITDDPLDCARAVLPSTYSVSAAKANETGNLGRMFNGGPANYADIARGWTFRRDFCDRLETQLASLESKRIAYVLGSAGVGKTTGIRRAMSALADRGVLTWEHTQHLPLLDQSWSDINNELRKRKQIGVLFIDDAHENLQALNRLVDSICKTDDPHGLRLVLATSKPNWNPRLKATGFFTNGERYELGTLSPSEIESLLDVIERSKEVSALVEKSFLGFNRTERRRRLEQRCRSDMFVCMKNIFASEAFDQIILREYADLRSDYQEAYKRIAGMESAGVRVHRQLILRTVNIQADQIERFLDDLDGIVVEETVNQKEGIFAWHVRHSVIADIIAKYKIPTEKELYELVEHVIDNLNPSYNIELYSINDICEPHRALSRIYDKTKQNVLLRKMISIAPRLRVPRHRLITNLIAIEEFEIANTEIRLFENELRLDGPVQRYKVKLLLERAKSAKGILHEDRVVMIRQAASIAEVGVQKFSEDKNMYSTYMEAGYMYMKYQKDASVFERAIKLSKAAYERILDPDLEHSIREYERIEQRHAA